MRRILLDEQALEFFHLRAQPGARAAEKIMEKRVKQYFALPSIGNAVIRPTDGLEDEQLRLDAAAVVGDRLPLVLLKTSCIIKTIGQVCRHCDHGQGYRAIAISAVSAPAYQGRACQ